MGKDLEIGVPRSSGAHSALRPTEKMSTELAGKGKDKPPESNKNNEGVLGHQTSNVYCKPVPEATGHVGEIANKIDALPVNAASDPPNGICGVAESKDKNNDGSMKLSSLQLRLKRLRSMGEGGNATTDDRHILRHSNQSAFSRYTKTTTKN